jgi:hypothetical protein
MGLRQGFSFPALPFPTLRALLTSNPAPLPPRPGGMTGGKGNSTDPQLVGGAACYPGGNKSATVLVPCNNTPPVFQGLMQGNGLAPVFSLWLDKPTGGRARTRAGAARCRGRRTPTLRTRARATQRPLAWPRCADHVTYSIASPPAQPPTPSTRPARCTSAASTPRWPTAAPSSPLSPRRCSPTAGGTTLSTVGRAPRSPLPCRPPLRSRGHRAVVPHAACARHTRPAPQRSAPTSPGTSAAPQAPTTMCFGSSTPWPCTSSMPTAPLPQSATSPTWPRLTRAPSSPTRAT